MVIAAMGCAGTASSKVLAMRFAPALFWSGFGQQPSTQPSRSDSSPIEITAGNTYAAERDAFSRCYLLSEAWSALSKLSTTSRASLTLRSSGPATAAARACAVPSVMLHRAGPAVHRIGPLSSNVRQRNAGIAGRQSQRRFRAVH